MSAKKAPSLPRCLGDLWEIFDRGDHLTTEELYLMRDNAEEGLKYLEARKEKFVAFKTRLDINRITDYIRFRELHDVGEGK